MKRWHHSLAFFAVLALILFVFASWFLTANDLSELIRAIQIPICIAVVVAYSPDAIRALLSRNPSGVAHLIVGIVAAWVGFLGMGFWWLLWRVAGQPPWMVSSDVPNVFAALTTFGAALHITAPGAMNGVPRQSAIILGIAAGCTVGMLLLWMMLHPDVRSFTDWLKPYLWDRREKSFVDDRVWFDDASTGIRIRSL